MEPKPEGPQRGEKKSSSVNKAGKRDGRKKELAAGPGIYHGLKSALRGKQEGIPRHKKRFKGGVTFAKKGAYRQGKTLRSWPSDKKGDFVSPQLSESIEITKQHVHTESRRKGIETRCSGIDDIPLLKKSKSRCPFQEVQRGVRPKWDCQRQREGQKEDLGRGYKPVARKGARQPAKTSMGGKNSTPVKQRNSRSIGQNSSRTKLKKRHHHGSLCSQNFGRCSTRRYLRPV